MLKNFINIPNFILLYYSPNELWEKLLHIKIRQIKNLYPKSKIHVLTNEDSNIDDVIIHKKSFENNHLAKFHLYSLLDEPSMYIDLDVMLKRRFSSEHLITDEPFNLYELYPDTWGGLKLCCHLLADEGYIHHYNAGVIWIKTPQPEMEEELKEIYSTMFGTKENSKHLNKYPHVKKHVIFSDEQSLSWYIHTHNYKMRVSDEVNVRRSESGWEKAQSVHYPYKQKNILKNEFHLYPA